MYSKITDNSADVFDSKTGNYLGRSHFTLTQSAERKLLDFLNYNKVPNTLVLVNLSMSETSVNYVSPELFKTHSQLSTLYIDSVDAYSGTLVPIEIEMSYDVVTRGHLSESPYSFESIELRNIKILDIDYRYI